MDFKGFFSVLIFDWIALMSGIASVALVIVGFAKKWQSVPQWAILIAAAVCFFCASVRVWTSQHEALKVAQDKLESLTKPDLSGSFIGESATLTGAHKENCLITAQVHIKNLGAPTALENFKVLIVYDNKKFDVQYVPPVSLNVHGVGGGSFSLSVNNHIRVKAGGAAIPMNIPVEGWFQVIVTNMKLEEFFSNKTTISFSFDDVATGQNHVISKTLSGTTSGLMDVNKVFQQTR